MKQSKNMGQSTQIRMSSKLTSIPLTELQHEINDTRTLLWRIYRPTWTIDYLVELVSRLHYVAINNWKRKEILIITAGHQLSNVSKTCTKQWLVECHVTQVKLSWWLYITAMSTWMWPRSWGCLETFQRLGLVTDVTWCIGIVSVSAYCSPHPHPWMSTI
jgi:hypothetical protein